MKQKTIRTTIVFLLLLITISISVNAQDTAYEIYALKFGQRKQWLPFSDIAVGSKDVDSVKTVYMYWLLKGKSGKIILVDAGFTQDAGTDPQFIEFTQPDSALEAVNVKPGDVTDIIITHPHWDHIGGIDLYPEAMVWMQKEDYDYFVGQAWQKEGNNGGFNEMDVLKIVHRNLSGKLTLIQGDDVSILPGIKVFTGSKHTYQSQFVLVSSEGESPVIIASDNAKYYYNIEKELPIPATLDAVAYVNNLKRMISMVADPNLIIPGHDPLVFKKFPAVTKNVARIR